MGLASQERMEKVLQKKGEVDEIKDLFKKTSIEPAEINSFFESINNSPISEKQKLDKIILRPNLELATLKANLPKLEEALQSFSDDAQEQAQIQTKYQVYIDKEKELVSRMQQMEDLAIPSNFNYLKIQALGAEAREKLAKIQPQTLGQASRISGINPSDVQILMVYMGR